MQVDDTQGDDDEAGSRESRVGRKQRQGPGELHASRAGSGVVELPLHGVAEERIREARLKIAGTSVAKHRAIDALDRLLALPRGKQAAAPLFGLSPDAAIGAVDVETSLWEGSYPDRGNPWRPGAMRGVGHGYNPNGTDTMQFLRKVLFVCSREDCAALVCRYSAAMDAKRDQTQSILAGDGCTAWRCCQVSESNYRRLEHSSRQLLYAADVLYQIRPLIRAPTTSSDRTAVWMNAQDTVCAVNEAIRAAFPLLPQDIRDLYPEITVSLAEWEHPRLPLEHNEPELQNAPAPAGRPLAPCEAAGPGQTPSNVASPMRSAASMLSSDAYEDKWSVQDAALLIRARMPLSRDAGEAVQCAADDIRKRLQMTCDQSGALQAITQACAISGSILRQPEESASGPAHEPVWSVRLCLEPRQREASTRKPEPLRDAAGRAIVWSAVGSGSKRRGAVLRAAESLLVEHIGALTQCCVDERLGVPECAVGQAMLAKLRVRILMGADHPALLHELLGVEEVVACDSEGAPAKLVQFYFPLARTVMLFERSAKEVEEVLLCTGITKITCDLQSETHSLGLTIAPPVVDLQVLFAQVRPEYASDGPMALVRMTEAMALGHVARIVKVAEDIYPPFNSQPPDRLPRRQRLYAAADAMQTGEIFLWLSQGAPVQTGPIFSLVFTDEPTDSAGPRMCACTRVHYDGRLCRHIVEVDDLADDQSEASLTLRRECEEDDPSLCCECNDDDASCRTHMALWVACQCRGPGCHPEGGCDGKVPPSEPHVEQPYVSLCFVCRSRDDAQRPEQGPLLASLSPTWLPESGDLSNEVTASALLHVS